MVYVTSGQFSSFYVSPLHTLPSSSSAPEHVTANRPGDEMRRAKEDSPEQSKGQVTRWSAEGEGCFPSYSISQAGGEDRDDFTLIMCPFSLLTSHEISCDYHMTPEG